jgi:hypothetical protein
MPALNGTSQDSAQAPDWGATNRLADALEHAEFIERVPALQVPWVKAKHPLLWQYMCARLAIEYAKPPKAPPPCDPYRCEDLLEEKRATGGLRRAVDMWARLEKAHRDYVTDRAREEKRQDRTEIVRRYPRHKRHVRSV